MAESDTTNNVECRDYSASLPPSHTIKMKRDPNHRYPVDLLERNMKCPEGRDRINNFFDTTILECYEHCHDSKECLGFSWENPDKNTKNNGLQSLHTGTRGECMTCRSVDNLEEHEGFDFFRVNRPCPSSQCFDRCNNEFGGSMEPSVEPYYCAKACEGMCNVPRSERYSSCRSRCSGESSNSSWREACEFGCGFWGPSAKVYNNKKCGNDRIKKYHGTTKDECFKHCRDDSDCEFVSYGEGHKLGHHHKGNCILCPSGENLEYQEGFSFWKVNAVN